MVSERIRPGKLALKTKHVQKCHRPDGPHRMQRCVSHSTPWRSQRSPRHFCHRLLALALWLGQDEHQQEGGADGQEDGGPLGMLRPDEVCQARERGYGSDCAGD
jgi:hypothetical protein